YNPEPGPGRRERLPAAPGVHVLTSFASSSQCNLVEPTEPQLISFRRGHYHVDHSRGFQLDVRLRLVRLPVVQELRHLYKILRNVVVAPFGECHRLWHARSKTPFARTRRVETGPPCRCSDQKPAYRQ